MVIIATVTISPSQNSLIREQYEFITLALWSTVQIAFNSLNAKSSTLELIHNQLNHLALVLSAIYNLAPRTLLSSLFFGKMIRQLLAHSRLVRYQCAVFRSLSRWLKKFRAYGSQWPRFRVRSSHCPLLSLNVSIKYRAQGSYSVPFPLPRMRYTTSLIRFFTVYGSSFLLLRIVDLDLFWGSILESFAEGMHLNTRQKKRLPQ